MDTSERKPVVGIDSCPPGESLRVDCGHQHPDSHLESLKVYLDLIALPSQSALQQMRTGALEVCSDRQRKTSPSPLCGYIHSKAPPHLEFDPLLPVEDEEHLQDQRVRENFVSRVYLYSRWQCLRADGLTFNRLVSFYADYKYLIMAHSVTAYKQLGPLLAKGRQRDLDELASEVIRLMMEALRQHSTPGQQANVLQHIQGYLKRKLSAHEKQSLQTLIEQYRQGDVPLNAPLTVLKHHFEREANPYIERQIFMRPFPDDVRLPGR